MLTQKQLKSVLSYDANTGEFAWVIPRRAYRSKKLKTTPHANGRARYKQFMVMGKVYLAHRLAWLYVYGEFPVGTIDHIDGDAQNNRISNLREVTPAINMRNQKMYKTNQSEITGVFWSASEERWIAKISNRYIGRSLDKFEACCLRKSAELKEHGYTKRHGKKKKLSINFLVIRIDFI